MRREKLQMKNGREREKGRWKRNKRGERGGEGSKISTFIVGISKKGCRKSKMLI